MAREVKKIEYTPYPSGKPARVYSSEYDANTTPVLEELIERTEQCIATFDSAINSYKESISKKNFVNTGNDATLNKILEEIWDNNPEVPIALYEKASVSDDAKHQYLADAILQASRSISGDFSLDVLDIFTYAKKEAENVLSVLNNITNEDFKALSAFDYIVVALEDVYLRGITLRGYKPVNMTSWMKSLAGKSEIEKAAIIQKNLHDSMAKAAAILVQQKSNLHQVFTSSDAFYKDKVSQINSGYAYDVDSIYQTIKERASLLMESARVSFQAVDSGISIKAEWENQSEVSGIVPANIAKQAYVTESTESTAINWEKYLNFSPTVIDDLSTTEALYVRKEGYSYSDAKAIVDILNSLPDTATYLRAGLMAVRAEESFVNDLIEQINDMPENSTLISGGMIALTGKTLSEFQEEIESGEHGYDTAQEVINALNLAMGYTAGETILLPGVIGLTGEGIRESIVDSINDVGEDSTLIGSGAILVSGDDTLEDKAELWDINSGDVSDIQDLLSYFSITDTTLIDGSKIYTGDILIDTLLSGMSELSTDVCNIASGATVVLRTDNETSQYLREIRSSTIYTWPTNASYLKYKLEVSANGTDYYYVRGGAASYSNLTRTTWEDLEGTTHNEPLVFLLDGNNAQYVRLTFGGFFEADDDEIVENLDCTLVLYGASAYIDGGNIVAESLLLTSMEQDAQDGIADGVDAKAVTDVIYDGTFLTNAWKPTDAEVAPDEFTGLFANNQYLGFVDDQVWKTYMDSSGNFYLTGSGEDQLSWDGETLSIIGNLSITNPGDFAPVNITGWYSDTEPEIFVEEGESYPVYGDIWVDTDGATPPDSTCIYRYESENGTEDGDAIYTNLCTNPKPTHEAASLPAGWAVSNAAGSTYVYSDGAVHDGITSKHIKITGGVGCSSTAGVVIKAPGTVGEVTEGTAVTLSVSAGEATLTGCAMRLAFAWWTSATGFISATYGPALGLGTDFATFSLTGTAPATASKVSAVIMAASNFSEGDIQEYSICQVCVTKTAAAVPYFDGSCYGCGWTGAEDASTSERIVAWRTSPTDATGLAYVAAYTAQDTADDAKAVTDVIYDGTSLVASWKPTDGTAPSGSGLFMNSTYMGFYDSSNWKTYIDSSGKFYLSGSGTDQLSWDGATLSIIGAITVTNTGDFAPTTADNTGGALETGTTITSGGITLSSGGAIKSSGKDSYNDTSAGFFLGYESGAYTFGVGDDANFLEWDGSSLTIRGTISAIDFADEEKTIFSDDGIIIKSDGGYNPSEKERISLYTTYLVDEGTLSSEYNVNVAVIGGSPTTITENTATDLHYAYTIFSDPLAYPIEDNEVYVWDVKLKANGRTWAAISIYTKAASNKGRYINLSDGTLNGTTSGGTPSFGSWIEDEGDGWYRVKIATDVGSGAANVMVTVYLAEGNVDANYTGDGSSGVYIKDFRFYKYGDIEIGNIAPFSSVSLGRTAGIILASESSDYDLHAVMMNAGGDDGEYFVLTDGALTHGTAGAYLIGDFEVYGSSWFEGEATFIGGAIIDGTSTLDAQGGVQLNSGMLFTEMKIVTGTLTVNGTGQKSVIVAHGLDTPTDVLVTLGDYSLATNCVLDSVRGYISGSNVVCSANCTTYIGSKNITVTFLVFKR